MTDRTCKACGFYSKWLPSCGDCMLFPYIRHAALARGEDAPPVLAATMTSDEETCDRWATAAAVKTFVHGGAEPDTWQTQGRPALEKI